ncbi:hypothetical protein L5876_00625 [Hyphobacterium sp. SN044]|uniref:hypothetical protein n=1 Tax=Hyphobacterium sp. SN044 TaxID=2912575 RepID=UPI001F3B5F60|nr:hypothetical protein [Hyphobacterium sp. SN044]MCF8878317.1 hypothetical protein [Hyphobacterium sp. SN044]
MRNLLLVGAMALASTPALADQTDLSFAVHDILITNNIPAVNISVRNMSASTDPAQRDLRMVSVDPVIQVNGQVWCKSFNTADTAALRARVMYGNANVVAAQNGADILPVGPWSPSAVQNFSGTHTLENVSISSTMNLPDSWNGGVNLGGFNPVEFVEGRLEHFLAQNAGSEADFLRVDDVFVTTVALNLVGWCSYESQNISGEYAGLRAIEVPVHIFYHGDPDIQDVVTQYGGSGTIAAQTPPRARGVTRTNGADTRPPARAATPARAEYQGGVRVASGDVNGDGYAGQPQDPQGGFDAVDMAAALIVPAVQPAYEEDRPCVVREEQGAGERLGRAALGMLIRSQGNGDGNSLRERAINVAADEVEGCERY